MKIQRSLALLLIGSVSLFFASCKKDVDLPIETCIAGTGGEVSLILKPEHHGDPIPSVPGYPDTAMIKFNTSEYPGDNPALYDLVVVGTVGDDFVKVDNLLCGKYFVYMTGKDTSLDDRVRGGIPITISETSGTLTYRIPITED